MKLIKKMSRMVSLVLILATLCSMTVLADSGNPHFDFEKREIYLAKGDVYTMKVYASDAIHMQNDEAYPTFSVYPEGKNSKKTYVWSNFMCGYTTVDIFIGEDETAKDFTLWFYIDGLDEYDNVNVHVVDPINSDVEKTRKAATYKAMGLDENGKKITK